MPESPPDTTLGHGRIESLIGTVLRIGVAISAFVAAVGGGVYLVRHGAEAAHFHAFRGKPANFRSAGGIVRSALTGSGRGIVQLGLLVLIATPLMRVVLSLASFARQRDWLYAGFTALVLALLLFSLMGA